MLITSSGGGVAIVDRQSRQAVFWAEVGNAHSAEALPGGKIAVAGSVHARGNCVALFDTSRPGEKLASLELVSAHGLVWDSERERLWALGLTELVRIRLVPSTASVTGLEIESRFRLPGTAEPGGHDLQAWPVTDELLVTTEARVWFFHRATERFRPHPHAHGHAHVKSASPDPVSGRTAWVQATDEQWWSDTVRFENPEAIWRLEGRRLYKARFVRRPASSPESATLLSRVLPSLEARREVQSWPAAPPPLSEGPWPGGVPSPPATIAARPAPAGRYQLRVLAASDPPASAITVFGDAEPEHDLCLRFELAGLRPRTPYSYVIEDANAAASRSPMGTFVTRPALEADQSTKLTFLSCARENQGTATAWRKIAALSPDAVVLLGDTPYIDSTALATQRARYRAFARAPAFAELARRQPVFGIWDDHDFGANDSDGRLVGKANSRATFLNYRPNPSAGHGDQGLYTSFRSGPIEVFLLDTRWFAATEPSFVDDSKPTLLGKAQWDWLRTSLRASPAPFKVLASGMIWNEATRPLKTDHWGHYLHERDALFRFLGEAKISGVVLVSGDIHRSRHLRLDTVSTVGYPLDEFITSPLHDEIIATANAPHPGLQWDSGAPHSFLTLEATTEILVATFHSAGQEILRSVTNNQSTLSVQPK